MTQQRLFRTVDDDRTFEDLDPEARGVIAIQQHSVFVEIVMEERFNLTTFQQYAAVVGLVKKCREVRNVFDNAVLWFNDQFLFGNKTNKSINFTPPDAMGKNPNRTITFENLTDPNRNNGTSAWFQGPNLVVREMRPVPAPVPPATSIPAGTTLEATITNAGTDAVADATVSFYASESLLGTDTTGPLARGTSATVSVAGWALPPGAHRLRVVVDSLEAVDEYDESDNERWGIIEISGAAPPATDADLVVTNIVLDPKDPEPGDNILFIATVRNAGYEPAPPSEIRFILDSTEDLGDAAAPALGPGEQADVAAPLLMVGAARGSHAVRAIADVDGVLSEGSETNNGRRLVFGVPGHVAAGGRVRYAENGTGPNEGGNPDRDGFIRARNFTVPAENGTIRERFRERWGGCFIPNGFVHAIGADDPYSTGELARAGAASSGLPAVNDAAPEVELALAPRARARSNGAGVKEDIRGICDNICAVKRLIELDNVCVCGIFTYVGSFFITDPNNHRWIVDEFVYPVDIAGLVEYDHTNCHAAVFSEDYPPDDVEDDPTRLLTEPAPQVVVNQCTRELERPETYGGTDQFQETDRPGRDDIKVTSKEPLMTVHVQVDPWNPDRQGFPDEAIWAYPDGKLRLGLPYTEDTSHFCHDAATVDTGKASAYEYDFIEDEGTRRRAVAEQGFIDGGPGVHDADDPTFDWSEFRRGPVGNTAECAIEYNFLLAVFFENFDDLPGPPPVQAKFIAPPLGASGSAGANAQSDGTAENEIIRRFKRHGNGGADSGDASWQGNSHPHAPKDCSFHPDTNTTTCDFVKPCAPAMTCGGSGPLHWHDALVLDLFFFPLAPRFTMENPYWDHYNETDEIVTFGAPPVFVGAEENPGIQPDRCVAGPLVKDPVRRAAINARRTMVCDVDAVDGYHLHDRGHVIPVHPPGPSLLEQLSELP